MIKTDNIRDRVISKPKLIYNNETNLNVILVSNYKFVSEGENELSVNKGDLLKFIEKKPNGWLLVKFLDKLNDPGLIPASYVDIVINDIKNPITLAWLADDSNLDVTGGSGGDNSSASSPTKSVNNDVVKDIRDIQEPVPLRNSDRVKNSYSLSNNNNNFINNDSNDNRPVIPVDPNNSRLNRKPSRPGQPGLTGLDSKFDMIKGAGKRHNSDVNDYKNRQHSDSTSHHGYGLMKPRNNSEPKISKSKDTSTYSTFNNPYLQQGSTNFKDFKADSFNRFSPPVSPIIPITQNSNQIQIQKGQQQPHPNQQQHHPHSQSRPHDQQSRSNSHSSNHSHGSFGSISLSHRKGSSVSSTAAGRASQETVPKINTTRLNHHPKNGSVSSNPRISKPISLSNPISPISPTDCKTNLKDTQIPEDSVIDFASDQYNPINKLKAISISNCLLHNDRYWYRIDLRYSRQKVSIGKFYHDFYNLQLSLMDAGYTNLPKLPPPIELNDDADDSNSSSAGASSNNEVNGRGSGDIKIDKFLKRCNELNNYLNKLIKLNYPQFNDWINYSTNKYYYIYNITTRNEPIDISNNDVNNKIMPGSVNLLYKPLVINLVNGNTNINLNVNKNEINSCKILKDLVNEKINFNHLLIKYNGKFELIDQVNWEFIKSQSTLEMRII